MNTYTTALAHDTTLKHVLIVDDNPDLRLIYSLSFDRRHFDVKVAVDGQEAIKALLTDLPDVLVLDINMPRLSGLEVLDYIRKHPSMKQMKVIVVTGNSLAVQYPETGYADLFLVKPVSISDLVTFAERLLAS